MKTAIIRHLNSGEHFTATLDDSGDVVALSAALPIVDFGSLSGAELDAFGDADLHPWSEEDDELGSRSAWTSDRVAVVHTF